MTTICMLVINIVVCGYTEIVKKSYELQKISSVYRSSLPNRSFTIRISLLVRTNPAHFGMI